MGARHCRRGNAEREREGTDVSLVFDGLDDEKGRATVMRDALDPLFGPGAKRMIAELGEGDFHIEITADEIRIGRLRAALNNRPPR